MTSIPSSLPSSTDEPTANTTNTNLTTKPSIPTKLTEIQTNSSSKTTEQFRTYTQDNHDETPSRVVEHYRDMRMFQTVDFYERMAEKYSFAGEFELMLLLVDKLQFVS
jgi:hypothetical protein